MSVAHFVDFKPTGKVKQIASERSEGKASIWSFTFFRDKSTECVTDDVTKIFSSPKSVLNTKR